MKYCKRCGTSVRDNATQCLVCSSTEFISMDEKARINVEERQALQIQAARAAGRACARSIGCGFLCIVGLAIIIIAFIQLALYFGAG